MGNGRYLLPVSETLLCPVMASDIFHTLFVGTGHNMVGLSLKCYLPDHFLDDFRNKLEWTRGMWADCGNVNSPVSLGLFEGEKKK